MTEYLVVWFYQSMLKVKKSWRWLLIVSHFCSMPFPGRVTHKELWICSKSQCRDRGVFWTSTLLLTHKRALFKASNLAIIYLSMFSCVCNSFVILVKACLMVWAAWMEWVKPVTATEAVVNIITAEKIVKIN